MHWVLLFACPISHLSAHTFFNSAAHSLIIHQSIYTFFYLSSCSPSLFFSLAFLSPLSFYGALLPVSCGLCNAGSPRAANSVSLYTILHSKLPRNISQLIIPANPNMFYTFSGPDSDFIHFTVN